jgi:ABC-2 type transport system ATP-binding protein
MDHLIHAEGLTKVYRRHQKEEGLAGSIKSLFKRRYEDTRAVDGVSFGIHEGELVGFLGPNGAGKTTTLKMLSGLLHPSAGTARVLGYTPWERKDAFRCQFALVMGNKSQLWFDIPAMESLRLNKEIYGVDEAAFRATVQELSALLEVEGLLNVPVRNLSLGERMKMELIASLLHRPKVLFLDEPTIGLDVISQKKIRAFLKEYNRRTRTTILLTSHYMEDIRALCARVMVINQGRLFYDGPLKGIASRAGRHKTLRVSFAKPVELKTLRRLGQAAMDEDGKVSIKVPTARAAAAAKLLLTRYKVADINIEDPPVEDLVRALFERARASRAGEGA